jgi:hypothetical protein
MHMHIDFDCHPPEHFSEAEKRQARLRYLARAIPATERELRALRAELTELKGVPGGTPATATGTVAVPGEKEEEACALA